MFDFRCKMDDVESARWTSRNFKAAQSNSRRVFKLVDARRLEQTIERHVAPDLARNSLLLTEAGELTAILAAGRKSAAANTSNIKHRRSYISS
jgi:hypothetical protein